MVKFGLKFAGIIYTVIFRRNGNFGYSVRFNTNPIEIQAYAEVIWKMYIEGNHI